MKKICLLITLLLFIPVGVKALEPDYDIDGLYINADILDNGDMLVREQIVMTGSFNGYIRDLSYKGNYTLYDASGIEIKRVCDVPIAKKGVFDSLDDSLKCFTEAYNASLGDAYVYQVSHDTSMVSLTMYNYNPSGTKIFYIEYLLSDVVVIHNDVAELYWTFIGQNFADDIGDVKITINLPSKATDLRVWAHGPLEGNITKENNDTIIATTSNLYAYNLIDVRTTFDKNIVPYGSKVSSKDAFDTILSEEKIRADEANRKRETAKLITYGMLGLNGLWIIGAVFLAIYAYRKYDKEHQSSFKLEYHREFPGEYGPEVVDYLMNKRVATNALSAVVLDIIRKKGFAIKEDITSIKKKNYILVKQPDHMIDLNAVEIYLVDWFIDDIGTGNEVALEDIKDASKKLSTAQDFVNRYNAWTALAKRNGVNEEFYEESAGFKVKGALYAILGTILFFASMSLEMDPRLVIITFILSIMLLVYILAFTKRTIKGNDHFVKWKAFKKFLMDFGRFNEKDLPEIALWDKYLVYATVFGIADKVSKAMEIKVKEMGSDVMLMPTYHHLYFHQHLASSISNTINTARTASLSTIAASQTSSGSGGGGGFSGGGGFGGGGVGGGGRGF